MIYIANLNVITRTVYFILTDMEYNYVHYGHEAGNYGSSRNRNGHLSYSRGEFNPT